MAENTRLGIRLKPGFSHSIRQRIEEESKIPGDDKIVAQLREIDKFSSETAPIALADFRNGYLTLDGKEVLDDVQRIVLSHCDLVLLCPRNSSSDFTCFFSSEETRGVIDQLLHQTAKPGSGFSFDCQIDLWENGETYSKGRVLACRCYAGQQWSFTIRKGGNPGGIELNREVESQYSPVSSLGQFVNSIEEISQSLSDFIFCSSADDDSPAPHGLVVVTGRTASAKSLITRRIIYKYLCMRSAYFGAKRTAHLITYEDPIEKYYFGPAAPTQAQEWGLDYTPRQQGKDTTSLKEVLNDALRQTPAVVFVGETRDSEDWKHLVAFGETGHLCFATAHAGSLSEAMGKILTGTASEKPADRVKIADSLLALIHIRDDVIRIRNANGDQQQRTMLIPALWKRTAGSAKALVAEGRTSLLPHSTRDGSSLGRYWFARELTKSGFCKQQQSPFVAEQISETAIAWDLEGI